MIGIIGGSSLNLHALNQLKNPKKSVVRTPFGTPSAPLISGTINGHDVVFLARHGLQHNIAPHVINYRANIWALHHFGCHSVYAFSALCSIDANFRVGDIVIPDQLIDYTWNRDSTFFDYHLDSVQYTEFAEPYSDTLRAKLLTAAETQADAYHSKATYGITQGPRYETRAEVRRYHNDGCHLLGMTGMPEAALAQEVSMDFAVCGLVTKAVFPETQPERLTDTHPANQAFLGCLSGLFEN